MDFDTLTKVLDISAILIQKMHGWGVYTDEQYNTCMNAILEINGINENCKEDFDNFMYEVNNMVDKAWDIAKDWQLDNEEM